MIIHLESPISPSSPYSSSEYEGQHRRGSHRKRRHGRKIADDWKNEGLHLGYDSQTLNCSPGDLGTVLVGSLRAEGRDHAIVESYPVPIVG